MPRIIDVITMKDGSERIVYAPTTRGKNVTKPLNYAKRKKKHRVSSAPQPLAARTHSRWA